MSKKTLQETREEYKANLPEDTKDAKSKVRHNGAKLFLRANMDDFEGDIKSAIAVLVGTGQRGGGGAARVNPKAGIIADLKEAGSMTNIQMFSDYNLGPIGMRELMKFGIRNMEPEDRVWIELSGSDYVVAAVGAEAPEDWDGYLPLLTEMVEDVEHTEGN